MRLLGCGKLGGRGYRRLRSKRLLGQRLAVHGLRHGGILLGLLLGKGGRELDVRHGLLGRGILLRCGLLRLWDGLGWLNRLGLLRHDGIRWNRLIALNLICRRRRLLGRWHLHGWRLRRSSLRLGLLKEGGRDLRRGITVGNICCSRVCRTIGDTVDSAGWGGGLRPVR